MGIKNTSRNTLRKVREIYFEKRREKIPALPLTALKFFSDILH